VSLRCGGSRIPHPQGTDARERFVLAPSRDGGRSLTTAYENDG
jgi:hypothetical protein